MKTGKPHDQDPPYPHQKPRAIRSASPRMTIASCCCRAEAPGAYHAGVYEGIAAAGFAPDWVVGISIGAINAALIAGNPPERRVERLREFWELVSSQAPFVLPAAFDFARPMMNRMAAASAMFFGIPGLLRPADAGAAVRRRKGRSAALSYYDTEPLRATLEELVDFDRINAGDVRLSLGAVNARTGESVYFDSTTHTITASHVMASGALPARLPAGGDRWRVLLRRRDHVQHPAAVRRAGLPHERADRAGRPVQRPGRVAEQPRPGAGAGQGHPVPEQDALLAGPGPPDRGAAEHAGRGPRQVAGRACAPIRRSRSWKR